LGTSSGFGLPKWSWNRGRRWQGEPEANEPAAFPNIFTALEKQLGLKLEKAQDVPVDMIVVEQVEKTPTEN
jgi:uncharacterized protein (TIGR03435 family)